MSLSALNRLRDVAAGSTAVENPTSSQRLDTKIADLFPNSCEKQVLVTDVLLDMGYVLLEGSLAEVEKDLAELGEESFKESLPERTNIRKKTAFSCFLRALAGDQGKAPLPKDLQNLKQAQLVDEPWLEEQKRLRHKATVRELASKLDIGVFTPLLLPGQELLAKATTAAQLGHFLPPSEESKQDSDRSYAKGLLSLLRSGVAAMLQHRMSPAALFSELAIALDMVVDSQLPPADAERVALAYTHKCRRLLYEASLNKPLKQGDEASFEDAMAIFLRKDPALHSEVRESLGVSFAVPSEQSQPAPASEKDRRSTDKCFCPRYALGGNQCPNQDKKTCAYLHSCPFCGGKQCGNSPGYLHKHLAGLRVEAVLAKAALTGTETVGDVVFLLRGVGLQQEELPEGLFRASLPLHARRVCGKLRSRSQAVALATGLRCDDALKTPRQQLSQDVSCLPSWLRCRLRYSKATVCKACSPRKFYTKHRAAQLGRASSTRSFLAALRHLLPELVRKGVERRAVLSPTQAMQYRKEQLERIQKLARQEGEDSPEPRWEVLQKLGNIIGHPDTGLASDARQPDGFRLLGLLPARPGWESRRCWSPPPSATGA